MAKYIFSIVALCTVWLSVATGIDLEKRGICPGNYQKGPNNLCFRLAEDRKNWHQAKDQCHREGGLLANTQENVVYDFVRHLIETNHIKAELGVFGLLGWDKGWWIGASRAGGGFKWLNGQGVGGHHHHWVGGQPDNFGFRQPFFMIPGHPGEDCLQQMSTNNGWNDYSCDRGLRYICQKTQIDPCAGFGCGKGRCVAQGPKASCVCSKGYTGSRCDVVIDPCKGVNCNNGKCVASRAIGGEARCICNPAWTGSKCDAIPNLCATKSPCQNGGKCVNTGKPGHPSYACNCPKNAKGRNCEKVCRFEVNKSGFPVAMDAMIVFDGSGSLGVGGFQATKGFITEIISELDISPGKTRLELIQFSWNPRVELDFDASVKMNLAQLKKKVANVDYMHYNTNTGLALEKAYDRFKTKGRKGRKFPKILFVVTDGVSSDPKKLPGAVANLKKLGVQLVAVGIGKNLNMEELKLIAGGNADQVFTVGSFKQLNHDLIAKMVGNICE